MALHTVSVGGSLIVPEEIDTAYLASLKQFITQRIEKGDRFILIAGGGKVARKYQEAAAHVSEIDEEEQDWLGIHSTRLNAHLLRTILKSHAHPRIFKDFDKDAISFRESILIGAGWKPGWSTDYIAVCMAERYGSRSIINLSNIEYVYSEDPRVNPQATRYETISWKDFRCLVGDKWIPGMSVPFDPIASQEAERLRLTVAIMNGKNFTNFNEYLEGNAFRGTLIQ